MSSNLDQQTDAVDLEQYAKDNKPVPRGRRYRIRIDKTLYEVNVEQMTGREILTLAGMTPVEKYILQQKLGTRVLRIEPDQIVDFTAPGVERFMTIPREVQDGDGPTQRRQHILLKADEDFLNGLGLKWETINELGARRVIIHAVPIPTGYSTPTVSVSFLLGAGYPAEQIDMAYFDPPLARADGRPIAGISNIAFDGKIWQQWSRHRTGSSTWRPDVDSLSTHYALVHDWIAHELTR